MEKLIVFTLIIAWFGAIASSLLLTSCILGTLTYSKIDELNDQAKGIKRSWPKLYPFICTAICWAWIIAFS